MSENPYRGLPPRNFWRSMAGQPAFEVDPVAPQDTRITRGERVATAGSCFAQHIAARLKMSGFNFYVSEAAHAIIQPDVARKFNYGVFSARYGNIYTVLQLRQLFDRVYGRFQPVEDVWEEAGGRFSDPFRPAIMPNFFSSVEEYWKDREVHFAAVRTMFENMDVFVFTLGLTECWVSKQDGAAYPLCPGVSAGRFDPAKHAFENHDVAHMLANMTYFLTQLKLVNPNCRVILTVSPVPLVATYESRHALVSTTYSKSALRVLADAICRENNHVAYFPSFEIITGNYNRGAYFADDLRNILDSGVDHVMRLFFAHFTTGQADELPEIAPLPPAGSVEHAKKIAEAICEEVALDASFEADLR